MRRCADSKSSWGASCFTTKRPAVLQTCLSHIESVLTPPCYIGESRHGIADSLDGISHCNCSASQAECRVLHDDVPEVVLKFRVYVRNDCANTSKMPARQCAIVRTSTLKTTSFSRHWTVTLNFVADSQAVNWPDRSTSSRPVAGSRVGIGIALFAPAPTRPVSLLNSALYG